MTFAILAMSTVGMAISLRRTYLPAWAGPFIPYWLWMAVPAALTFLGVELPLLQKVLQTTNLTGAQWQSVLLLALVVPVVIEATKAVQRARRAEEPAA
jgi:Ca2+-transporting ATPase